MLGVVCTATATRAASDSVALQSDGVHFLVHSPAAGWAFQVDGVGSDNAPSPEGTLVWPLPPGPARIWCGSTDPTDTDWVAVEVVDPQGLFVPDRVSCASAARSSIDHAEGARGEQGNLVAVARRQIRGLRPDDTVEPAGYPATADREVRVVRGEETIAVGSYSPDGNGGWLLGGVTTCADTGIQWGT